MSHSVKADDKVVKPIVTKKYKFTGKETQRFTIGKTDYCLVSGAEVTLPSDDKHVKRLIARGKLNELKNQKPK